MLSKKEMSVLNLKNDIDAWLNLAKSLRYSCSLDGADYGWANTIAEKMSKVAPNRVSEV